MNSWCILPSKQQLFFSSIHQKMPRNNDQPSSNKHPHNLDYVFYMSLATKGTRTLWRNGCFQVWDTKKPGNFVKPERKGAIKYYQNDVKRLNSYLSKFSLTKDGMLLASIRIINAMFTCKGSQWNKKWKPPLDILRAFQRTISF